MSEENKNMNENANAEVAEVKKESKVKGFLTKAGKGVKKHGGKIAAGVAVVTVGALAYMLGSKSNDGGSDDDCYGEDDVIDVDCSEAE